MVNFMDAQNFHIVEELSQVNFYVKEIFSSSKI